MADKESTLTLSDLVTGNRDDSMEQDYAAVSQARDEASSPTAQLIAHRKAALVKTFRPDPEAEAIMPEAGIVAPGAEPDKRGVPAAPGEKPAGGLGHVESQSISREPLVQEGTIGRGAAGRDILPSIGEAVKQVGGGVMDAVKGLLSSFGEFQAFRQRLLDEGGNALRERLKDDPTALGNLDALTKRDAPAESVGRVLKSISEKFPEVEDPKSIGGSLIRGLSAFLGPFALARKGAGALPMIERLTKSSSTLGRLAGQAGAGGLAGIPADMIAFDPESPRFSNLVESLHPSLKNPVTEFLAAPEMEEGQELELHEKFRERLKSAGEGVAFGAAIDVLVSTAIAARQFARVRSAGKRFEGAVKTAMSTQRAGERGAATVEEAAGPLAHDRRKVTMPAATERRGVGVVEPEAVVQDVERGMAGQPAEAIEAEINRRLGVPPPQAMPQRLDAAADVISELHRANGGSTFNLKHGDLGGQEAYAVGFAPDLAERIPGHPTRDQIRAFIERVSKVIPLDDDRVSIGTYFENGFTDLDVVATPRTHEQAVAWGKSFNQRGISNLKTFEVIDTGGTGLDLGNLPPLADRLKLIYGANGNRVFPQSVRELTERNGEAARQGLGKLAMKWLRDETGAVTFSKSNRKKAGDNTLGHPYTKPSEPLDDQAVRMAQEYDAAVTDPAAKPAWDALASDTDRLFQQISKKVQIERVTGQPYASAAEMNADIAAGRFKVTTDNSEHPFWDVDTNWKFRVVHDYLGHFVGKNDFSLAGEKRAYLEHLKHVKDAQAKPALQLEIYGQAAANVAHGGEFQPQKAFITSQTFGVTPDEFRQLGLIGAAALARGQKAAFQNAIESAFSVGGRLAFNPDDVLKIRAEAEKVLARNVKSAMDTSKQLSKELGDENSYHGLPNTGRLLGLFNEGKFALGWYDGANTELRRWFGKDADLMADIIAATSPRTNPDRNIFEALETYIGIKQGKTIDELDAIFSGPAAKVKRALVQRALDGLPIETPKAGAFAKNIKGDPNAVTIDVWMARAFYGRDQVKPVQSEFLQEWVRQLAYSTGVAPRQMQAAIWTGIRMEREFLFEGAPEFAPLREIVGAQAKQAFEDSRLAVPESMRNDAGFSRLGMLWFLSRVSAGALFGASGENQSMEDRVAGALYGAGIGAGASPKLVAKMVKKMADVLTDEKIRQAPRRAGQSSAALGIAGEPIKPEAHSFASLADEYAQRVKEATRGEVLDEESGFVKVRPREVQFAEAEVVRQQMTPESIQQLMPTIRMNDSESIAMAQVMNEVGLKVRSLAITAKQGGFRPDDVNELLKELYLLGRMDPKRLGALAEAGRTLGALNDPVSGQNAFLDQFTEVFKNAKSTVTPQRVAEAIASFKTPEELAVFARQLTKPGMKDYFFEVWINGLLSGPKTLIVNGLGNSAFLLYNIGERSLAAGIRSQGGVAPGEAAAMAHGIVEAHQDALRAFWAIVRDAEEIPGASKLDQPRKAITSENLNLTGTPGRAIDLLGSAIRTPGRVLAGTDEYFKALASRAEIRAMAKREAYNEVEKLGLRGRAAVEKMHEIEQAFLLDPPVRAMQKARQFSEYITFTSELGETGQAIQALQRTAIGRVIVPFVRTPINLAKRGLERSGPLGLASSQLRAELNSADPAVRDLARAKVALSSMTLAVIGVMAANGYVTGGGPQDPVLRKQWLSAGYQPYSFDVGALLGRVGPPKSGDLVSFGRLDPIAMPFGMMADVVNLMGHLPPDEQEELASALVIAFSKNFTSKTFVQGVARTTVVMADPERLGGSYLKNFLTSATVPFSSAVRQAASALDPELKDAQGIIEEYARRIPGASTSVPADLDLFGNPRYLGGGLGRDLVPPTFQPAVDFVVPIYVSTAAKEHQDIFAVLNENAIRAAEPPKSIDGVVLSNVEIGALKVIAGKEITPEGMTLPQALKKLFQSPAWKAAAPGRGEGREALANIVIRGYYKGAIEVLQDRFKDLKRDVRNARVKRLRSVGVDPRTIEDLKAQIGID